MTVLLTSASGFLGRYVLAALVDHQPLRLLLLPHDPALPQLRERAEVVVGDVTQPDSLPAAFAGVTHVIHLAGYVIGAGHCLVYQSGCRTSLLRFVARW